MKVEFIGTFYNNHSLSIVNRNLVIELSKYSDIDLCITPLDNFDSKYKIDKESLRILDKLSKVELEEPEIQVRHTYPPIWRWPISDKTKVVFIQPWEFSKVPFEWQYKWEQFADAVICPSKWTADRYLEAGLNPKEVFTIANGYDPKVFNTEKEDNLGFVSDNKITFTYVGCGQFRKGVDILIDAWRQAFVKADKAQLLIKDTPDVYGENQLLHEILRAQYLTGCAEIIYNDDNLSDSEIANIYKHSDVLVHPYRGEGFGMHIQEAMACGTFPLITQGGAPDDFVNESCGMFINSAQRMIDISDPRLTAGKPGDSFTGMHQLGWALEPHTEDLVNKFKGIYHHNEKDKILSSVKNAKLTTWEDSASIYKHVLQKVNEEIDKPKRCLTNMTSA